LRTLPHPTPTLFPYTTLFRSRLRALATLNETKLLAAAKDELLKAQNDDGSWSQLSKRGGDAYATATVLMALRTAGVSADHAAYRSEEHTSELQSRGHLVCRLL